MNLFRKVSEEQIPMFKAWARTNYVPYSIIKGIWHPIVQAECVKMNEEEEMKHDN
jgi:hypothetical protein